MSNEKEKSEEKEKGPNSPSHDGNKGAVENLGKRSLLITVGLAVAAVLVAVVVSWVAPGPDPEGARSAPIDRPPDPEVLALFGNELARTRRLETLQITRITGVDDGAIRVEMTLDDGQPFRIEILRRDANSPEGVAQTPSLGLYLIGKAGTQTPEPQAQAVQLLAKHIAAEEAKGIKIPALKSMKQREEEQQGRSK